MSLRPGTVVCLFSSMITANVLNRAALTKLHRVLINENYPRSEDDHGVGGKFLRRTTASLQQTLETKSIWYSKQVLCEMPFDMNLGKGFRDEVRPYVPLFDIVFTQLGLELLRNGLPTG